jgi:WD40 repeat protein
MPRVIQAAEFFVVGGPVQPDRLCYVERSADSKCTAALAARKYCHVLGPRAIGKSSLMGRVAKSLRQRGELAATVDLAQLQARGESDDAGRWIYGIANKVVHELRLQVDLATWWQEANALAREHRLADFFWEIVLTNTTAPITVLIDDIEQAVALPFGRELFSALRECRTRRKAETDFARLSFVVLGAASLRDLGSEAAAPLAGAEAIELGDFTAEESYRLAIGLGGDQTQALALMDRVCVWTNGHPYLTQKVARAVARKGGKLEDVERVVREQLLVPLALLDEPPLAHARAVLTSRTPAARQALKALRRVARGGKVAPPRDAAVLDVLRLAGAVGVDDGGLLRYRNRIFKEQLGARWLKAAAPARGRTWAAAAVLLLAAAGGGYWYTQYAPLPYVRTLTAPDVDPDAANEAYGRLRRLPGFAARADELLGDALIRRSGTANTYAAALAIDAQLRQLPAQQSRADALLADFWLRKSDLAAHAERRDAALLLALRAATTDAANPAARARAAELVSDDYRGLVRTTRFAAAPTYWSVDWPRAMLLSVDAEHSLARTPLNAADAIIAPAQLTALRHVALVRELRVGSEGSAGAFQLTMAVRHAASREVQVTLSAPSGAQATFVLPQGSAESAEDYVFSAAEGSPLAGLADEGQRGVWRLSVVDRRVENSGVLFDWGLRFGDEAWSDDPDEPIDIPEPARTAAVSVAPVDKFAVVQPVEPSGVGTVALWNLVEGRLQDDFTLPAAPQHVDVNATATRMLAVAAGSVTLFNVADGGVVARLATQTEFVLPPVFSADGGYLAIAERVDGAPPLYSLLSSVDGALLASVEGVADARSWLLGPGARYLALSVAPTLVRVLDPRRGTELARLAHGADVQRVLPLLDGSTLLTIDARGDIRAWDVAAGRAAGGARWLGTTADAASASLSADGARLAYAAATGEVVLRDVASGAPLYDLRLPPATPPTSTRLSPDGTQLVTATNGSVRVWSLDGAAPAGSAPRADVVSVAVDPGADVVALGFRGGDLVARAPADLDLARDELGYFGHGGAVTSVAVNAARGLIASGGADGTVRIWDLATALPAGDPLRHGSREPATAVALSADGALVASTAGDAARIWNVAGGSLVAEIAASGGASAVAIAPAADFVAVGDNAGQLALVPLGSAAARRVLRVGARPDAIAFAPNGAVLATGDVTGGVRLWRLADAQPIGEPLRLPRPVRRLYFDATSGVLIAATDYWLHSVAVGAAGLTQLHSRLAPVPLALADIAAAGGEQVRVTGIDARGALRSIAIDLAAASTAAPVPERDWAAALGVKLDDAGELASADF